MPVVERYAKAAAGGITVIVYESKTVCNQIRIELVDD